MPEIINRKSFVLTLYVMCIVYIILKKCKILFSIREDIFIFVLILSLLYACSMERERILIYGINLAVLLLCILASILIINIFTFYVIC
jgi:hypothetical protein